MIASGLYGELVELHNYLHLYLDTTVEVVKAQYRRMILAKVKQLGIDKDMEVNLAAMIKEMLGAAYPQKVAELLAPELAGLSSLKKEEMVETKATQLLTAVLSEKTDLAEAQDRILGRAAPELTVLLKLAVQYERNFRESDEIGAFLAALDGRFILPGPGGDRRFRPAVI